MASRLFLGNILLTSNLQNPAYRLAYCCSLFRNFFMIRNLFFDLDDTLWDTYSNNKRCLEILFTQQQWSNYVGTFNEFFAFYYPNNESLWHEYRNDRITKQYLSLHRFSIPFDKFGIPYTEDSINTLNEHFLLLASQQTKLIEGALPLLENLQEQGYNLYIITNGFKEIQRNKLINSGLMPYFKALCISEELGAHKPNIGFFHYALTRTNSKRSETVVIGDSLDADIQGADRARLRSIWFNPRGYDLTLQLSNGKPIEIKKLEEVPQALEQINME